MDLWTLLRTMPLQASCSLAAGAGVMAHLGYFIRGYRVPETAAIIAFHLMNEVALLFICLTLNGVWRGLVFASAVSASYFVALFTSIIIYRVYFHPLRHFPGPLSAKITKFSNLFIARNMQDHQNAWTQKYGGSIIRIAPNELLLVSIDGQQKVHGSQSRTHKHQTFYDFINYKGAHNLDSITNREEHRWRRLVWDRAFNTKAIARYETYAQEVCRDWLEKLDSLQGQPVNVSLYSMLIPFDNMGKMGYSHNFNTVKAGKEDHMLSLMETTFGAIGKLGQITWPIKLAKDFDLSPEQTAFENLASTRVDEREENDDGEREDILKYLLQDLHAEKPKAIFDRNILYSDSQVIMIAGTDTIAAVLTHCFYYLAKDPSLQARLKEELSTMFEKSVPGAFAHSDLVNAELLNAIIDETMRMHNAVCNNGARCTPPEGLEVDGQFIPGNVTVFVGIHAMHRSPKFFKQPDDFIPERWTTRPDLVIDKRAFHPFLVGPFSCVGRRIALTVLRLALSYTVWNYDFKFAPGEDGKKIFDESWNNLVLKSGSLHCVFTKRD